MKTNSVRGYEDYYTITENGDVWSVRKGRYLKPQTSSSGYKRVVLHDDCRGRNHYVHRLVIESFVSAHQEGLQANHIDGDKMNNHISNLEWCTAKENIRHAYRTGLKDHEYFKKPVVAYVGDIMHIFDSCKEGCEALGVKKSNIPSVLNGSRKTAGGYYWRLI